jgi:hypothetical protein
MCYLRFDLKFMFLLVANACVVAWGLTEIGFHENIVGWLVAVIFASLTVAWYGRARGPLLMGTIGGFSGAAALALCYCALHAIGYFFHNGPEEYFEDGAFFELVMAPPIYVASWGLIGAGFGAVCGVVVWAVQKSFCATTKMS